MLQHSSSEVPEVRRQSTRLVGGTSPHDDVLMIWIPFQRVGIKQGKHQRSAFNQYRCTLNVISRAAFAVVMGILVLAAGCGMRGRQAAAPAVNQPRPRSTATLQMLEPLPGSVITNTKLRVRLALNGGRIIQETTTRLAPDEGHIHLLVDGQIVSMLYGLDQEVDVAKGAHLLQAEYVANDHFPFNPRVIVVSTIVVQ